MMTFKIEKNADNEKIFIATNSIKPVSILPLDEYNLDFHLNMPEGDLYNDFPIMNEWFDSFESARKFAENKVGVKI